MGWHADGAAGHSTRPARTRGGVALPARRQRQRRLGAWCRAWPPPPCWPRPVCCRPAMPKPRQAMPCRALTRRCRTACRRMMRCRQSPTGPCRDRKRPMRGWPRQRMGSGRPCGPWGASRRSAFPMRAQEVPAACRCLRWPRRDGRIQRACHCRPGRQPASCRQAHWRTMRWRRMTPGCHAAGCFAARNSRLRILRNGCALPQGHQGRWR